MRWILHWIVSAASLAIVAYIIPGFHVNSVWSLLVVALLLGIVNGTLGALLHVLTLPITILTFGIFWFIVNAAMLELISHMVKGFWLDSFWSAFWAAVALSVINTLMKWLMPKPRRSTD